MCRSNYLEISREALRRNAAAVREAVRVPIIGVLKCNGYGVTVSEAVAAWKAAGVTMFGVSRPEEALALRGMGVREDILLLCPVADLVTLTQMLENRVILTVSSLDNARFYSRNAADGSARVHIAIDTGMGRFGIRWNDAAQVKEVYSLQGLSFEGIFSHFACSFEREYKKTKLQLSRFLHMTQQLQKAGYPTGMRHIANSSAALRFPETHLDAVRIGSALVGKLPAVTPVKLESVSSFNAQVVDMKQLQPGDTIGYGSCCKVCKHTKAAIVALGRADGFGTVAWADRLHLKNLAHSLRSFLRGWLFPPCVVCNGEKLPVLGRVGNQYTLFDATGTQVKPGDTVQWDGNLMLSICERRFV